MNVLGLHVNGTVFEGVILLAVALILKLKWPTKHWGDVVTGLLGLGGVCDLLDTAPARWAHNVLTDINDWATQIWFKWGGAGPSVMAAAALIGIIILLVAWHPKGKIKASSKWVLVIALLLPLVVSMIPGKAGDYSVSGVEGVANATHYPFSHWLGV